MRRDLGLHSPGGIWFDMWRHPEVYFGRTVALGLLVFALFEGAKFVKDTVILDQDAACRERVSQVITQGFVSDYCK